METFRRHEIEKRIMQGRDRVVDGGDDLFVLVRTGDCEDARVLGANAAFLDTHAAGDDDAAVLGHCFANGVQAFGLGTVEEAAGVDDHHVGAVVVGGDLIAFRAQARDDALAIDEGFRAAE